MRQGGYLVTRGLTGNHSNMIVRGLIPFIEEVIESLGGRVLGSPSKKRKYDELIDDYYDEYTILAELSAINGKDLFNPIINKVNKKFKDKNLSIQVEATNLVIRSPDIKVNVKVVGSRYVKN